MTNRVVALLFCSICAITISWAAPSESSRAGVYSRSRRSQHISAMDTTQRLMADRLDLNVRAKKEKAERERAFAEVRMHEDLTDPAVDLYGEDSWGKFVNPLTEMSAEIPDSYDIDCSGFVMPIESRKLTSGYGYRKRFGRMHYGTDMGLVTGDTIVSAFDGRVRVSSFEPRGYGHYVIVRHPNGLETIYGHMSRRIANEGDIIKAGQPIGLGGNTGRSTGPHLHFECRFMGIAINPADLFDLEQGVPLDDVYHFRKGAIQRAVKSPIYRAGRKAGSRSAAAQRRPKTHRIKRGDTLSAIAKRNSTTVSKIKRLNPDIKEGNLQINRSIRVK